MFIEQRIEMITHTYIHALACKGTYGAHGAAADAYGGKVFGSSRYSTKLDYCNDL
jgi:hypothetical protein